MPVLIAVHLVVCVLIVFVVLMQRPRSEGLGAAFGGGMTENLFGAQTTHVLAKLTTWLAAAFFGITLLLSILTSKSSSAKTSIQETLLAAPIPQASAAPSASPAAVPLEATPSAPAPAASPATSPAN
ncbi:MAG: preprotein translocase subunit SecG [Terrimicrobiaceae bacterium]